jgi:hypothetical protein
MTDHSRGPACYYPMPASSLPNVGDFREIFKHPTHPEEYGVPIAVLDSCPIQERGSRRKWRYVIAYAKRYFKSKHIFQLKIILKCIMCIY